MTSTDPPSRLSTGGTDANVSSFSALLERIRRPEFTGENRCLPCSAVNLLIGGIASAVLGAVSIPLGVLTFGVAAAVIYFRGYLIPYTPALTKRYLPDRFLAYFEHGDEDTVESPAMDREDDPDEILDPGKALAEAGILEPCEHGQDLCLHSDFRAAWDASIDRVRTGEASREVLASLLGVERASLSVDEYGEAFVASVDDRRVGRWESEAAFLADVAAAAPLADRYDGWEALPGRERGELLASLRLFLETCPACGGSVSLGTDVVESCCRDFEVVAVSCADCGARIFEEKTESLGI